MKDTNNEKLLPSAITAKNHVHLQTSLSPRTHYASCMITSHHLLAQSVTHRDVNS